MRKLTVSIKPNFLMKKASRFIFEKVEKIEMQELLRLDFSNGTKIVVADIRARPGIKIQKDTFKKKVKILSILDQKENVYTCLVRVNIPKTMHKLLKFFDFDVIYDIPTVLMKERFTYSMVGEEKNLKRFLKFVKLLGKVDQVGYKKADYRGHGISKILTEKQNLILKEAIRWGYYRYPREIDTKELAKRVGVSRTTLVEHLRKAENRVMGNIFAD